MSNWRGDWRGGRGNMTLNITFDIFLDGLEMSEGTLPLS